MIKPKSMKHLFLILVVISLSGFGQDTDLHPGKVLMAQFNIIADNNKTIQLNPNDFLAYYNRGNAKFTLKTLIDKWGPEFSDEWAEGSDNYKNEAISDYNKAIQLKPDYAAAYNNRGCAKEDLKDYTGAIADYSKAIQIIKPDNPNFSKIYFKRGNIKYILEDYLGSMVDYNKVIQLNPNFAEAYYKRGISKKSLKFFLEAIADFKKAIELEPDFAKKGDIDETIEDLKNYTEQMANYNIAIRSKPNDADEYNNRALAKYNLQDYIGAIADYDKVIQLKPDYASIYNNRGLSKYNLQDYIGAKADYDKAIKLKPDYASAYNNRGVAKFKLQDYSGVIADYNKLIKIIRPDDDDYSKIYYRRGIAKFYLDDKNGACEDIKISGEFGYTDAFDFIIKNCN